MTKIFVYGEIGLDNLIYVPHLPQPEKAAEALEEVYTIGGAASNVAVLLANWGLPISISGNALGEDWSGRQMRALLQKVPNLDLGYLEVLPNAVSPYCRILITPDGERSTIFYHANQLHMTELKPTMLTGRHWLALDLFGGDERIAAGQLAHRCGLNLVIGDLYRTDHTLLPISAVITNSAGVIRREFPGLAPNDLARALQQVSGGAVITTDGPRRTQLIQPDGAILWATPPQVRVQDSTGAGDALKAGILYGLAQGWSWEQILRWGIAAGAITVQRSGAVALPPTVAEVQQIANTVILERE